MYMPGLLYMFLAVCCRPYRLGCFFLRSKAGLVLRCNKADPETNSFFWLRRFTYEMWLSQPLPKLPE